ncbi:MAG: hypothetical protein ACK2TS_07965, partial [Anaerolineales bacterium]
ILETTGDGDQRSILASLYGIEVASQLLVVIAEEDAMRLSGFISPISLTRSNRRDITFFVNGRWVQDTSLTTALVNAYHSLLMVARYPIAVLFLDIEPSEVDVNVHPAKAEVRFRNNNAVFSFIQRSSRKALLAYSPIPSIQTQKSWGDTFPVTRQIDPAWNFAGDKTMDEISAQKQENLENPTEAIEFTGSRIPLLRLVGQVGLTYLVAEGPDGLYLVDQHAAHERVLFEKLLKLQSTRGISSQALLSPVTVTFPPEQANLVEEQLPLLEKFGFTVELFGPGNFQVRAIPALFKSGNPVDALKAIVEDFEEDEEPLQGKIEALIAGRVCKSLAIKAGQSLSAEEQKSLLVDLEACDSPRTCPHGRPTMIHLSVDMLERQFGRKGAR